MKKVLTVVAGLLVVWGWLVVAAPALAHDRQNWVEHERQQINREREAMHREFDAMMRDLDAEGRR